MSEIDHAAIMDSFSTGVLITDEKLAIKYINHTAEQLLGMSARLACSLKLFELVDNARLINRIEAVMTTGGGFTEWETALQLATGDELYVDWTCKALPESNGLLVEMRLVNRHVRSTREANLEQQQDLSREVVRGLAHEIKNPLGGLRGAAQLLDLEVDSGDLKEYSRIIVKEADRLTELVDRLLGPNSRPSKSLTNIHEITEHVRKLVEHEQLASGNSQLTVHRDYDPSLPELTVDKQQLTQAVLNLAKNAVQAMEGEGTLTLRTRSIRQVTIGKKRHKLALIIDVIDTGPGIPAELKNKLFYPMVTGRAEGTGLGLSITQSLIKQHGGAVQYSSEQDETRFTVLLPFKQDK